MQDPGSPVNPDFLAETGLTEMQIGRIVYLVGHRHTFRDIDGLDYQILVEADYIANVCENAYSRDNVRNFKNTIMKTDSVKRIAASVFMLGK
ncbi:MAG: hypothetical protein IJT77_11885 [Clostridia bacterium]|nr:hypothetical protein [Clostridia bacterium]